MRAADRGYLVRWKEAMGTGGYVVAAVAGYLLGSLPAALIVARRHGVDLRRTGDGNPGAWNALEQLGARRALPAFLGDAAKGLAAGLVGLPLAGWWGAYAGVAGAMVGHAFPLFAGLRGGKAVMTFVGGAFVLDPVAALVCVAACAAITLAGRRWSAADAHAAFARGARVGVFGFPLVQIATGPVEHVAATGALMSLIGLLFALRRGPASGSGAAPQRA
jgi:acyl phosphate:glycerol-3-phosphate acyltransferase